MFCQRCAAPAPATKPFPSSHHPLTNGSGISTADSTPGSTGPLSGQLIPIDGGRVMPMDLAAADREARQMRWPYMFIAALATVTVAIVGTTVAGLSAASHGRPSGNTIPLLSAGQPSPFRTVPPTEEVPSLGEL